MDFDESCSGEVAVRVLASELSLKIIEELIKTNEKLKDKLQDAKESLSTLSKKLNDVYQSAERVHTAHEFKPVLNEIQAASNSTHKSIRQEKSKSNSETAKMIEAIQIDFNSFINELADIKAQDNKAIKWSEEKSAY
eukprot:TRINITY_DN16214_c0_g2_i1.p1 TRINITY_DN16214_c0_g2~~TRINITY_DN16214_c0_g2_i1.p1  ORF type:complete len:137 (+),score=26.35 TRINITY_DN16214_c0_g2_i1:211-621(+)